MDKVNTFIIGAQKAGTTSLYQWLGQHPEIKAPEIAKDYHFFSNEDLHKKGLDHFHSFYEKSNKKIRLHSAVNYLYHYQKVAKRLYDYNPAAKIIVCLRDPVERAISAYKYFRRTLKERSSFDSAMQRELNGDLSEKEKSDFTYLGHGEYFPQIMEYHKYFGKQNIKVLLFEELIDKNTEQKQMEEIFRFLEVDSDFKVKFTHLNKSGKPKNPLINYIINENFFLKKIRFLIPFTLRKRIASKIEEYNISDEKINVRISPKNTVKLQDHFTDTIEDIEDYLNKDLSGIWNRR